jgi:alpha-galactosidase
LEHLIRSSWKDRQRPVLVNNWEATYFDFNADKLLAIAKEASSLGLDMLVLDDGWFGKRDSDYTGLGDWYVNEEKLGCSLKELVDQINALGLMFGIWFEPEMISEDSDLYRAHPDWAMIVPGREPIRGRSQLVLDMTREDVQEYIKERLFAVMDSANIQYIKWDMNRSIAAAYSALLPGNRQGEMRHRYVLGLYSILEALLERYPDLLLEGCSGGGGRYDAGMLYYAPQIWCSDNTDAVERLRIQYGTSFGYPMSSVSAHVSVCPNHQNGRVTPLKTRGVCAMQGTFGYELDLSKMTEDEKSLVKEQVQTFKKRYKLFQFGRYYRITSPYENHDFTAWEYAARDGKEAVLSLVATDLHGNPVPHYVKLKGLNAGDTYKVYNDQELVGAYTGAALMQGGFLLPVPKENFDSCQFYMRAED